MGDAARIVLGTAQWGLDYGIANAVGRPSRDELRRILDAAAEAGIDTLDTARAYGDSEQRIGELAARDRWRVMTKLAPDLLEGTDSAEELVARTVTSLAESRRALVRDQLDVVLLHRPEHRHAFGGAAWTFLQERRAAGEIGALGVSALSPPDAIAALDDDAVQVIQVAASLLDQRLARVGFFDMAAARGRAVYARSIFLQGAALLPIERLPEHLRPLSAELGRLDRMAAEAGVYRTTLLVGYARQILGTRVVVGCETVDQLQGILRSWAAMAGRADVLRWAAASVRPLSDDILEPARWPAATRSEARPGPS